MAALKQGLVGAYVNAMGQETLIAPITPGTVFETRLNRTVPTIITYRALSPVRLLRLSEERFQEFLQNPEFAQWCSAEEHRPQDPGVRDGLS
ncbi:MAG: cyclic nucleotide-binding domain-containing protein [Nitratireductor sp.]|nr:cyclic nucleotide-binding domain-containing protein [Nitratireductor sp.]